VVTNHEITEHEIFPLACKRRFNVCIGPLHEDGTTTSYSTAAFSTMTTTATTTTTITTTTSFLRCLENRFVLYL
jgi:hypothetical protein